MKLPIIFQRAEGAAIFLGATAVYFLSGLGWIYYVIFLLAFDVFMVGYLINSKAGAITYNVGHSLTTPCLLAVAVLFTQNNFLLGLTCLWFAHIGLDRALGYGLKTTRDFKQTHLGTIGK